MFTFMRKILFGVGGGGGGGLRGGVRGGGGRHVCMAVVVMNSVSCMGLRATRICLNITELLNV